ncbi:diguanylate cyclase [Paenibacillus sp. TRM 82003]|uniref:GGDEF domain-containing protein n=1 Tax=Kineococcus sp. TRM81007 TaxID=2925831 RepID=UPI001F560317|nr:sensor domain-containing diguanylate cyclase [Kineococcus sp. TRM81007]MCI2238188.1 diguanylate cyclase [Kineococcus sp. TRM81007]MCI3920572.1 diguanylate cyclase [Paenibacillus sp. TRM 82003]
MSTSTDSAPVPAHLAALDAEVVAALRLAAAVAGLPRGDVELLTGDQPCALEPGASCACARVPVVGARGTPLGALCLHGAHPDAATLARLEDVALLLVPALERRPGAGASREALDAEEQRTLAELVMAEVEHRRELTEAVLATVDVGILVADPDGRLQLGNDTATDWLGQPVRDDLDAEDQPAHYGLYRADGRTLLTAEDSPLQRALRGEDVVDAEVVVLPFGRPARTVLCTARTMSTATGNLLGAVLAMHDVTAARAREAALAEAHAQLAEHAEQVEALARASRAVATAEDPREAVCEAVRGLTGADAVYLLQPEEPGALVSTAAAGVDGRVRIRVDVSARTSLTATAFLDGEQVFAPDVAARAGSDPELARSVRAASAVWQPVLLRGDEPIGVLSVVWHERVAVLPAALASLLRTFSGEAAHAVERADLLARLARAAERDALTGLANRRHWDETAPREISRAGRTGVPLTFVLVDLDHFKRYNDTFGHLEGDALLREFAERASSCLREVDTLARWGGEEFVLALPGCTAADAVLVADRIRAVVPRGQSATAGVAQWVPGTSAAEVLARADEALYRGKHAGRDATVVAPGV